MLSYFFKLDHNCEKVVILGQLIDLVGARAFILLEHDTKSN